MFLKESIWIKMKLAEILEIKTVLDIGSSTLEYRSRYVGENVFNPLYKRGVKIDFLDQQAGEGVDIVCDITDSELAVKNKYDVVICANVLEHLDFDKLETACNHISSLLKPTGYLIVTVPYIFPYHIAPIDNMLRPDVKKLQSLFPNLELVSKDLTHEKFLNIKSSLGLNVRAIFHIIILLQGTLKQKIRFLWLNIKSHFFRQPVVSCAVFRKNSC